MSETTAEERERGNLTVPEMLSAACASLHPQSTLRALLLEAKAEFERLRADLEAAEERAQKAEARVKEMGSAWVESEGEAAEAQNQLRGARAFAERVLRKAQEEARVEGGCDGVSMTMRGIWAVREDAYKKLADRIAAGEEP